MEPPAAPAGAEHAQDSPDDGPLASACATAAALAAAAAAKSPPVVDPDLPGWVVIQRTTQTGRSYKVYHGPRGEYAESRRQALLLASGEPLTPAQLAPKSKRATLPAIEGAPAPSKAAVQAAAAAAAAANAVRTSSQALLSRGGNASKGKPVIGSFHTHGILAPLPMDGSSAFPGPTRALQRALARATSDSKWCVILHPADVIYDGDPLLAAITSSAGKPPLRPAAGWPRGGGEASAGAGTGGVVPPAGFLDPEVAGSAADCLLALGHAPPPCEQAWGPAVAVNTPTVKSDVTPADPHCGGGGGDSHAAALGSQLTCPRDPALCGGGAHAAAPAPSTLPPDPCSAVEHSAGGGRPKPNHPPPENSSRGAAPVAAEAAGAAAGTVEAGEGLVSAGGMKRDWHVVESGVTDDDRRRRQRMDGAALHVRDTAGGGGGEGEAAAGSPGGLEAGATVGEGGCAGCSARFDEAPRLPSTGLALEKGDAIPETAHAGAHDGAHDGAHGGLHSSLHGTEAGGGGEAGSYAGSVVPQEGRRGGGGTCGAQGGAGVQGGPGCVTQPHSAGGGPPAGLIDACGESSAIIGHGSPLRPTQAGASPGGGGNACGGPRHGVRQQQGPGPDTEAEDGACGVKVGEGGSSAEPPTNLQLEGSPPRHKVTPSQGGTETAALGSSARRVKDGICAEPDAPPPPRRPSAQGGPGAGENDERAATADDSERGSADESAGEASGDSTSEADGESVGDSASESAGESGGDSGGESAAEQDQEPGAGGSADDAEMRDVEGLAGSAACPEIGTAGAMDTGGDGEAEMETGEEECGEEGDSAEDEGDETAGVRREAGTGLVLRAATSSPLAAPGACSVRSLAASHFRHKPDGPIGATAGISAAGAAAGSARAGSAHHFRMDEASAGPLWRADSGGGSIDTIGACGDLSKAGLPTTILGAQAGKGKATRRRHEVRRSPYTPFKTRVGADYQSDLTPFDPADDSSRDDVLVFEPSRLPPSTLKSFLRTAAVHWPPSADSLDRRAAADPTLQAAAQEAALAALHSNGYDAGAALAQIEASAPPASRASWTDAQCLAFDSTLLSHGKDFNVIAKAVGCPVGAAVRRYYERKCRTDLCQGPPAMLSARPVSILSLLADEIEANASSLASQRASALTHHSQHAAAAVAIATAARAGGGMAGHVGREPPGQRTTVWQSVGEIVSHSTGIMVSPVYCGHASSFTLQATLGLAP